jgi:hypothetical protein
MIGMTVEAVEHGQDAELSRAFERCRAGRVHADDCVAGDVRKGPADRAIEVLVRSEEDRDEKTRAPRTRSAATCNSGSRPTVSTRFTGVPGSDRRPTSRSALALILWPGSAPRPSTISRCEAS